MLKAALYFATWYPNTPPRVGDRRIGVQRRMLSHAFACARLARACLDCTVAPVGGRRESARYWHRVARETLAVAL